MAKRHVRAERTAIDVQAVKFCETGDRKTAHPSGTGFRMNVPSAYPLLADLVLLLHFGLPISPPSASSWRRPGSVRPVR
jgi:hypothetical protein